jgi:hypothetical protein
MKDGRRRAEGREQATKTTGRRQAARPGRPVGSRAEQSYIIDNQFRRPRPATSVPCSTAYRLQTTGYSSCGPDLRGRNKDSPLRMYLTPPDSPRDDTDFAKTSASH